MEFQVTTQFFADGCGSGGLYRGAGGGRYGGYCGATEGKEKRGGSEGRPAFMRSIWSVGVGCWHLAVAEGISLGLSCCGCQVMVVGHCRPAFYSIRIRGQPERTTGG